MEYGKLLRIEWTLNIYSLTNEHEPLEEIDIHINTCDAFSAIVSHDEGDDDYINGYELSEEQVLNFNKYLKKQIIPDASKFIYVLVGAGIYSQE